MLVGLWLIIEIAEHAAVFIATLWMLILIGLGILAVAVLIVATGGCHC